MHITNIDPAQLLAAQRGKLGFYVALRYLDMTQGKTLRLYELVLANGLSASPYVWRIRYALAYKGIPFESVPIGFTEIPKVFQGRFKTVPVIEHGDVMMAESWDIAEYLDKVFPDRPLFSSVAERAMIRLAESWMGQEIFGSLHQLCVLDVHNAARAEDQPYFRQSREAALHKTLEAYTAGREGRLTTARAAFKPLRAQLARFPFLGGQSPNYFDYIVLGVLQWVASAGTLALFARDDEAIRNWVERGLDLYGGVGRDSRMRPLFE